MKLSLKTRIVHSMLIFLMLFTILALFYAIILKYNDWLLFSLPWSISFGIGYFIKITIKDDAWKKKTATSKFDTYFSILVIAFAFETLFLGSMFSLTEWAWWATQTYLPFCIGLILV